MITKGMVVPRSVHARRIASISASSSVMWTVVALSEMERAYASVYRAMLFTAAIGTITVCWISLGSSGVSWASSRAARP